MGNAVNHTAQVDGRTQARRDTTPRKRLAILFTAVLSAHATPRLWAPTLTIRKQPCALHREPPEAGLLSHGRPVTWGEAGNALKGGQDGQSLL